MTPSVSSVVSIFSNACGLTSARFKPPESNESEYKDAKFESATRNAGSKNFGSKLWTSLNELFHQIAEKANPRFTSVKPDLFCSEPIYPTLRKTSSQEFSKIPGAERYALCQIKS